MSCKAVFHIDLDDQKAMNIALENVENLLDETESADFQIHMVSNGESVRLFRREFCERYESRISNLSKAGVRFCLCRKALNKLNFRGADMHDVCEIVPDGIVELCRLQSCGCAYIKA